MPRVGIRITLLQTAAEHRSGSGTGIDRAPELGLPTFSLLSLRSDCAQSDLIGRTVVVLIL